MVEITWLCDCKSGFKRFGDKFWMSSQQSALCQGVGFLSNPTRKSMRTGPSRDFGILKWLPFSLRYGLFSLTLK